MNMTSAHESAFVVLHHIVPPEHVLPGGRGTHFDLMLELHGVLKTWAIEQWPFDTLAQYSAAQYPAAQLPDHRIDYLRYEGPISNNRGEVRRVASGSYRSLSHSADTWEVELVWANDLGESNRLRLKITSAGLQILSRS